MKEKAGPSDVLTLLKKAYPQAQVALSYSSPLELLIAVILSAQCTDEQVNKVTARLFNDYRTLDDYADADIAALERAVHSTGFFRNKARNIQGMARMLRDRYHGRIPDTMEEILNLPGVARKTANIVLGNVYGVVEGIAVDTHVRRIARLLGWTREENPVKIERDLMKLLPRAEWFSVSYLLQSLGRDTCTALRPRHEDCVLRGVCPSARLPAARRKK